MRYGNYHQGYGRRGHHGTGSQGGGQSYVWKVSWLGYNGFQCRAFKSKAEALIFKTKLESNLNNGWFDIEKVYE